MIDIENRVINTIREALTEDYPNVFVSAMYLRSPEKLPAVTVIEMSNTAYKRTQDSSSLENHAQIMYQVDVYDAWSVKKKSECRAIMKKVDEAMCNMNLLGFTRVFMQPTPNMADATIYRITARYEAVVSQDGRIMTN